MLALLFFNLNLCHLLLSVVDVTPCAHCLSNFNWENLCDLIFWHTAHMLLTPSSFCLLGNSALNQKQKDMQYVQMMKSKWMLKMGISHNTIKQKHFRAQVMF